MKRLLSTRCLIAAGLLFVVLQDVAAQTNRIGIGSTPCAEFSNLYRDSPDDTEAVFYSWAMGAMSGLNVSLHEQRANLSPHNFSAEAQKAYLRRFCEERPTELYVEAVFELYATLRTRQALPPWRFIRQRHR